MGVPKKKTVIILLLLLMVAIAAILIFVFVQSERNPYIFYTTAESKHIQELSQRVSQEYETYYKSREPYINNTVHFKNHIDLDVDLKNASIPYLQIPDMFLDIFHSLGLNIEGASNLKEQEMQSKASVMLKSTPIINGEFIANQEQTLVSIPSLIPDTYFKFNNIREAKILEQDYALAVNDLIFKTMPVEPSIFNEDFANIRDSFIAVISPYVSKDSVSYGQPRQLQLEDQSVEVKSILVEPDATLLPQFAVDLQEWLAQDNSILKLAADIYGEDKLAYNYLSQLMGYINSNLDALEHLHMELLVDSQKNILQRDINWKIRNENTGQLYDYSILLKSLNSNASILDKGQMVLEFNYPDVDKEAINSRTDIKVLMGASDDGKSGDIEIVSESLKGQDRLYTLSTLIGINDAINVAMSEKSSNLDFKIELDIQGNKNSITGSIKSTKQKNEKHNISNTKGTAEFYVDLPILNLTNLSANIDFDNEETFVTDGISINEITDVRIINMDNLTDEELGQLQKEFAISIGMFMLRNQSIFGDAF